VSAIVWRYRNPVRIEFGVGVFAKLPALMAGRRYVLVTYPEPAFARLSDRLASDAGPPAAVIDDVSPNPDFVRLAEQTASLGRRPYDVIVALGGGSVIDTAKALAAAPGDFTPVRRFVEGDGDGTALSSIPILAVPTTAGTGSEVTCWATLWDEAAQKKYSLSRDGLYPERAIVDPELMRGKPRGLTVATGLDALSHALESIWNINANAVSTQFAVSAARRILAVLPRLVEEPDNLDLRTQMAQAALFAGLAFSNTKTALSHSLSYPITLRHGVAHGIACSFTLPQVLMSLAGRDDACTEALMAIFDAKPSPAAERLVWFMDGLGVSCNPHDHGVGGDEWDDIVEGAFAGERGRNFIGTKPDFLAACSAMGYGA
jgi:phosphonate metabolism-associated iron-containing alcohol dehydrogenase